MTCLNKLVLVAMTAAIVVPSVEQALARPIHRRAHVAQARHRHFSRGDAAGAAVAGAALGLIGAGIAGATASDGYGYGGYGGNGGYGQPAYGYGNQGYGYGAPSYGYYGY